MVSRPEIITKPIAILHASHRGDDILEQLRLVLSTVSAGFMPDVFERLPLISKTVPEIEAICATPAVRNRLSGFLDRFLEEIAR